jgi:hypothetical protein
METTEEKPYIKFFTSVEERVMKMNDQEIRALAKGEALAAADSSRIEGLILDQEELEEKFYKIYKELQTKNAQAR